MLADHMPGTQDYSGMSFEGLRAALQILSEVHSLTKPLHCHYPYHEPLHYILSVYPKPTQEEEAAVKAIEHKFSELKEVNNHN